MCALIIVHVMFQKKKENLLASSQRILFYKTIFWYSNLVIWLTCKIILKKDTKFHFLNFLIWNFKFWKGASWNHPNFSTTVNPHLVRKIVQKIFRTKWIRTKWGSYVETALSWGFRTKWIFGLWNRTISITITEDSALFKFW